MDEHVTLHEGLDISHKAPLHPTDYLPSWLRSFSYYTYTIYLTCYSNLGDIILSGLSFGVINSLIAPHLSLGPVLSTSQILTSIPAMLLWSWSNLFLFCLHNQRHPEAVAEDLLNKPWRPIPAGRLTSNQATRILYFMHPFCLFVASVFGGFWPYLILTMFHVWYNEFGGASNPILKNVHNGVGICCFFAGPLEVATKRSIFSGNGDAAAWLMILMGAIATISHTQDFRDMKGDKIAGRRTIPLVLGDLRARILVVLAVVLWTQVACIFWAAGWRDASFGYIAGVAMVTNLLLDRSKRGDIRSWRLFAVWLQSLVLVPYLKNSF